MFKTGAKKIGARFGIMPGFMAKPLQGLPGCSGHIHQRLSDGKNNLFYDAGNPRKMGPLFESYVAGQVACMMDFDPMVWPTINSCKRLVDGFWAPVKPTWELDNCTASFRVIAGSPKATRLETRCPGADVNPYLAMAAVIAAGLDGVEKGLKLTAPPITGSNGGAKHIGRAPRTLIESHLSPAWHPLCDGIALEGARLAARALPVAFHTPGNLQARGDMTMASTMGAIAFQKDLGAVHSCAHALGAVCDMHHGLANALMIDTVLAWNHAAAPAKFDELAHVCGLTGGGQALVPWLRQLQAGIGLGGTLCSHGVGRRSCRGWSTLPRPTSATAPTPGPARRLTLKNCLPPLFKGTARPPVLLSLPRSKKSTPLSSPLKKTPCPPQVV